MPLEVTAWVLCKCQSFVVLLCHFCPASRSRQKQPRPLTCWGQQTPQTALPLRMARVLRRAVQMETARAELAVSGAWRRLHTAGCGCPDTDVQLQGLPPGQGSCCCSDGYCKCWTAQPAILGGEAVSPLYLPEGASCPLSGIRWAQICQPARELRKPT